MTLRLSRALTLALCLAVITGCPRPRPEEIDDLDVSEKAERWYRLSWHGAAVGWAVERETEHRIQRVEHLELLRGDVSVTTELTIEIDVETDLTPRALRVRQQESGRETTTSAERRRDGWHRDGARGVFAPATSPAR